MEASSVDGPSASSYPAGTPVWVTAADTSCPGTPDEVGTVVSSSLCDYRDPRTGETSREGLLVKLTIGNTRSVVPMRRLRRFETEPMDTAEATNEQNSDPNSNSNSNTVIQRRRSSRRRVAASGVVSNGGGGNTETPTTTASSSIPTTPTPTPTTSACSVGTEISKEFEGVFYSGKVTSYDAKSKYFRVRYEDGDEEELRENDIERYLVAASASETGANSHSHSHSNTNETENETETDIDTVPGKRKPAATTRTRSKKRATEVSTATATVTATAKGTAKAKAKPKRTITTTTTAAASKKARRTASASGPKNFQQEMIEVGSATDDDDDSPLIHLKKQKPPPPAKKNPKPRASKASGTKTKTTKTNTNTKTTTKKKKKKSGPADPAERDILLRAALSDSDDEKDMPFNVEYSSTGRATCKSCDEKIPKNALRVASRPLFRGKPGFVVYRHLLCQTFPEEIETLQHVGGWRRLKEEDKVVLEQQLAESKLRLEEENQEMDADELVPTAFQGELREPPPGLVANLLPFQSEGVSWMYQQERSRVSAGGILADEMGMGKTLQTITTILDHRPRLQHAKPGSKHPPSASASDLEERLREESLWNEALEGCHHDLKMADVPKQILAGQRKKGRLPIGARAGTLVVCPLIALYQWKEEIQKFTEENALTIGIYHGNDRHERFPRETLSKYDVVLTTYQVLEADFRKMISPNKVKCPNCGRSFKMDKLAVHLRYFCGATARRTAAQSRQRRSADRPPQAQAQTGTKKRKGSGATATTKTKMKEKSFDKPNTTRLAARKPSKKVSSASKTKKVARVTPTKGYESDSELSLPEDVDVTSKRSSRSAAKAAAQRLSSSFKDWAGDNDSESDSDDFSEDSQPPSDDEISDDDDDDDDDKPAATTPSTKARKGRGVISNDDSSLSYDSSSEDDASLARARKRQKLALSQAKNTKSKKFPEEKLPKKTQRKSFGKNRGSTKKSFPEGSSDDDDDDDDKPEIVIDDPLSGIDMEKLKANAMEGCQMSVLHTLSWWRIVLDEAHVIKSRSSSTSSAAFHLTGIHRWALSGTPLQNRVGELYSLIRFLRIDPMAHYFCRRDGCDCKSIYYRMFHGKCKNCGCPNTQHFSFFNKHVLNVIQRDGYTGDGRRAMLKLKTDVLDKCLLRRTKESRAEDMNLPPRVVVIKPIRLHPREEDFYNALYTQTKNSFNDYVTEGTLLNNYAHIFDLLTKMRQAVDHPYMIVYSKKNYKKMQEGGPAVANGSTECELCEETPTDRVLSTCCGSAFCRSCVIDMMTLADVEQGSTRCPCCRAPFSIDINQTSNQVVDNGTLAISDTAGMPSLKEMKNVATGSILRRINLAEFSTSTKLEALVQELYAMRRERSGSKALVFSQFTSMLDLCRWRLDSDPCLQDLGLGVRIVHGGMNVQSRDEALKAFKEDPSVRVLLMSLKAGGVALNLTVANEAYLLDPWWNPAAEMQAIDRTHRLGQYRPIRAVRFIAEGTVEERVLQLQEKKRLVFDGTVGRDAASLKMLTVDDMKALFT